MAMPAKGLTNKASNPIMPPYKAALNPAAQNNVFNNSMINYTKNVAEINDFSVFFR